MNTVPKFRPGSLGSNLLKARKLDDFMLEKICNGKTGEELEQLCATWGIKTTTMSISRFLGSYSLWWRVGYANDAAEAAANASPPNIEEKIRKGIKQQEFSKVFSELTVKEIVALKRASVLEGRLEFDKQKLAFLEKQRSETLAIVDKAKASKGGLTPETLKAIEEKLRA